MVILKKMKKLKVILINLLLKYPFCGDDKNDEQFEILYNKDKSKFFNYDFFGNDNNEYFRKKK